MKNVSNGHGRRTSCEVVSKRHKKSDNVFDSD